MNKTVYYVIALLLAAVQGVWAQAPTPSTELEPYFRLTDSKMVFKFNYPSTSVTGEPVVLSSLLCCWTPKEPESGAGIESVHLYNHFTISANSQSPTSYTRSNAEFVVLSALFEGSAYDEKTPYRSVAKRSIVIIPDYEGYGVSRDRLHPYLVQEVTAKQVVDAMTYGLELYGKLNGANNTVPLKNDWRCFSLGYSQGGAVALAVQRYIERNNLSDKLHFRGTICGDGPYDLIATMRYYMDDNGTSYGVTTAHRKDQVTLPVVLPMIINGMIASNPAMSKHKLEDFLEKSFLDTGVIDWLNTKNMSSDDINTAWLNQIDKDTVTIGGKDYPAPKNMKEMFFKQQVPGMIWGTQTVVWGRLDKIFTTVFYNYMKNLANFSSAPTATGNPYEDMRYALESNNVCTGWEPQHRIQFVHSKGDMVVPYGNYLAFRNAHPNGENNMYRIEDAFSDSDHLKTGSSFLMKLGTDFFEYFQWIDNAQPTGIYTVQGSSSQAQSDDAWYDLSGRKLATKPTKKGVYIHHGKKYVFK